MTATDYRCELCQGATSGPTATGLCLWCVTHKPRTPAGWERARRERPAQHATRHGLQQSWPSTSRSHEPEMKGNPRMTTAEERHRAPVDALLIAQAVHRDDAESLRALFNHADLERVAIELARLLTLTIRRVDGDAAVDHWLDSWLRRATRRIGEGDNDE